MDPFEDAVEARRSPDDRRCKDLAAAPTFALESKEQLRKEARWRAVERQQEELKVRAKPSHSVRRAKEKPSSRRDTWLASTVALPSRRRWEVGCHGTERLGNVRGRKRVYRH
jgi:hypothetical protein